MCGLREGVCPAKFKAKLARARVVSEVRRVVADSPTNQSARKKPYWRPAFKAAFAGTVFGLMTIGLLSAVFNSRDQGPLNLMLSMNQSIFTLLRWSWAAAHPSEFLGIQVVAFALLAGGTVSWVIWRELRSK